MEFHLKKILKALLLSTSEPVSIKDVQEIFRRFHAEAEKMRDKEEAEGEDAVQEQAIMRELMDQVPALLTATQIRDAMETLQREMEEQDDVGRIAQGPAGYRIVVAPQYADWVRLMRDEPKPTRLSQAALETLAIVAYRQPVTRAEMEAIRGVSIESALSRLMELDLVCVTGRADLPGRPIQYGTTESFLEFCGLTSIDELPASDALSPSQINEWLRRSQSADALSDADMGLPPSEEEAVPPPPEDDPFDLPDAPLPQDSDAPPPATSATS